jgi:hypothetical protein
MVDMTLRGRNSNRASLVAGAALAVAMTLGFAVGAASVASADIVNGRATNVQEGDNDNDTNQEGRASSGDAVAGQVVGVVSSGDTSLDATNLSRDVDAESGDAEGANAARSVTGTDSSDRGCPPAATGRALAQACPDGAEAADIANLIAVLVHLGDNASSLDQSADVSTGDAIAGQVAGAVVSGLADIVLANTSEDVDAESGDGEFSNLSEVAVGSSSVTFGRRCVGGCPLPQDLAALLAAGPDVDLHEVGAPVGLRSAPVPDVAPLGTPGTAAAGLVLFAAVWVGRRRRVYTPALSSASQPDASGHAAVASDTHAGESKRPGVTRTQVTTAALVVLGSFLVARRIGRR